MSGLPPLSPRRLLRRLSLGTPTSNRLKQAQKNLNNMKLETKSFKKNLNNMNFETKSLKKHVENYAKRSNIRVSNTNMNFLLNKVKNNYTATIAQKKRYLTRLMYNMRFPPMFSENIKKKTNKNRKITRQKGKSRLSK